MSQVIFSRVNQEYGLSVTVTADWDNGRFLVLFVDTDSGNEITRRVYSGPDSAIWYANRLIQQSA